MKSQRGFTLLELLVAAAITAGLAGFIAIIVRNVGITWSRTSGRLGADAQARLVLSQLELDIQGALFRDDGNVWLAADVLNNTNNSSLWQAAPVNQKPAGTGANSSLLLTPANITDARFGQAGVWLRFFTTRRGTNDATSAATTIATSSAPVAVSYQIIRYFTATNPANTTAHYSLFRAEVRPAATSGASARPGVLESGYDVTAAAYTTVSGNNSGGTTGDPVSMKTPGSTGARNLDSIVADNVIDFGVRCYVRDATQPGGLRLVFPTNAAGQLANAGIVPLRAKLPSNLDPQNWSSSARPFPEVIDVMVRVLTPEGATLIANMERVQTPATTAPAKYNNNAQQWWWGVAMENSRVYTRRIVLNAKSS